MIPLTGPICMLVVVLTFAPSASAATRYVRDTGVDGPGCGQDVTTACRSISQAIESAAVGDTINVGPGRYGDLNRNGTLGDPGEETGAPGCSCVLAMNKAVIIVSSAGASVTILDGRSMDVLQNVVITDQGEFGRPGKGFTVTGTAHRDATLDVPDSQGIVLDAANVMVRGNIVAQRVAPGSATGISTVNDTSVRIEGNQVVGWHIGIASRRLGLVSKNHALENDIGLLSSGGMVSSNIATANEIGISVTGTADVINNGIYSNAVRGMEVSTPFSGVINKNNLFGNGVPGQCLSAGLYNAGASGLNAINNYWGTPGGPAAPPADAPCNNSQGTINILPFAKKPFTVTILKP
jgi:hypothetical protein